MHSHLQNVENIFGYIYPCFFSDNENLTFRGNSIATKAMEAYMKLVGEKVSIHVCIACSHACILHAVGKKHCNLSGTEFSSRLFISCRKLKIDIDIVPTSFFKPSFVQVELDNV